MSDDASVGDAATAATDAADGATADTRLADRTVEDTPVVDHATGRWTGIGALALGACGAGVLAGAPGPVLAGVVGAVLAVAARSAEPVRLTDPETGDPVVSVRRELDSERPDPGDEVTVTVAVANEGDGLLTDLRVVDGVPPDLEVVDGSPRHSAVLRPGGSTGFAYTVVATRGEHDWQPARVAAADPTGSVERETPVPAATTLRCALPAVDTAAAPLQDLTAPAAGHHETATGGPGLAFHATREYRPGDPLARVDWNRRAKTGELGTVEFRERRAATVLVVVDARRAAYRAPAPGAVHAVERSVAAANRLFAALLDDGDRVGLAAFAGGPEAWLAPGTGPDHRARGREFLTTEPALAPTPPERGTFEGFQADRRAELRREAVAALRRRLPAASQVVFCSPCCDDYSATVARRLDTRGHPVTVLAPDPTTDDGPGETVARLERADRLTDLRRAGIPVVDWSRDERIAAAVARARERWSP
ncbi:DUF58 domain-containing protein [Halosimplex halophilum]|uniref:DUF58 domain-containing protein n=1 Tax=Halosimplex halophilum TaxID=2559572 RepID=UPI00107F06C6|nr:DUF58 domain-containing protein [Halosimplex halophilum]